MMRELFIDRGELPYEEGMKISGKPIAEKICEELKPRVGKLQDRGITPTLAVILVGEDPASITYVRQKKKIGEKIGVSIDDQFKYSFGITTEELLATVHALNSDPKIHGIIIQQPLPLHVDKNLLINETLPAKDVDGFHPNSHFDAPVALAVLEILKNIYKRILPDDWRGESLQKTGTKFSDWLHKKIIVVNGKGETAGKPIQELLTKRGLAPKVIDSKTPTPELITTNADVIISAVGKPHIITKQDIKKGAILISVGMHQGEDGKLHGDYDPINIARTASFYTPVPGGVGPVNVAMLLSNVVLAAENSPEKIHLGGDSNRTPRENR